MAIIPPVVASQITQTWPKASDELPVELTMPTGVKVGDYLITFLRLQVYSNPNEATLSGFTRVASGEIGSTAFRYNAIFVKAINNSGQLPGPTANLMIYSNWGARTVAVTLRLTGVNLSDAIAGVTTSMGTFNNITKELERGPMNSTPGAVDFFYAGSEFGSGNDHVPTAYPSGNTQVNLAVYPTAGELSTSRTSIYVGRRNSSAEIAADAMIKWTNPSAPASMGISINGISDGSGGIEDTYMTPVVVGDPIYAGVAKNSATFTINRPNGLRYGDILVCFYRTNGTNSPSDFSSPGFTRYGTPFVAYSTEQRVSGVQTRVVGDIRNEPASYTFTKSVGDTRTVAALIVIRNADLPTYITGEATTWSTASPDVIINTFPVATAPAIVLAMFANEETAGWSTMPTSKPAGFLTVANNNQLLDPSSLTGTRTSIWVGKKAVVDAGVTGDITAQWGVNSANGNTGIAIKGKLYVPPSSGVEITLPDGKLARATIMYGGSRVVPARIYGFRKSYPGVFETLRTPGVTMAHRGGSTTWPEMSEYAYDRSVARGYNLLEFSAQRSSDGWWFGMHDNNFDRTSKETGTLPPSFYTQADIQLNFMNEHNADISPRPYYGLTDFLDKYAGSNTVVVDPKNQLGYTSEFLDVLDAHGGPSRIIVKFFGVGAGGNALADAAAARGYESWGYYYEPDHLDGDMMANQSHWSILGMSWDASPSAWAGVKSFGKPVMAHICATQEQYDIAIAKGADLVQCSGVNVITAVPATK